MAYQAKRRFCAAISLILVCALGLTGCSTTVKANDLMAEITPTAVTGKGVDDAFADASLDFAVRLLQGATTKDDGKNLLVSPLSVQLALAMTANGAKGDTLAEMEAVIGGNMPIDDLNKYLYAYHTSLPSAQNGKLHMANSIWFCNGFDVNTAFLQTNADYYGADAYRSSFDDRTVKDINNWVDTHTDGMIDKLLDHIDSDTVMYLINALVFDAEWQTVYKRDEIADGWFTTVDGTHRAVEMMSSSESVYYEDENAVGFAKPYAGGQYCFVALLPDEDVALDDYVAGLSGERLKAILGNPQNDGVSVKLPKFSYDYSIKLNDTLAAMGMPTAFGSAADLSGIADADLCIGEVLHKTKITVDERGTKAGAVTAVGVDKMSIDPNSRKSVVLDRPFVYMIVDGEHHLPIFIGAVNDIP